MSDAWATFGQVARSRGSDAANGDNSLPEPRIASRLLLPLVDVLRDRAEFSQAELDLLEPGDPEARVPLAVAHRLLDLAIERAGDPTLGLQAGRATSIEHFGVLAYAVESAATARQAIAVAKRCSRLLSDALEFRLTVREELAIVALDSHVPLSRASADFHAAVIRSVFLRRRLQTPLRTEWWFPYSAPSDISEYRRTFGNGRLHFEAEHLSWSFEASRLDEARVAADPDLHRLVRHHAENLAAKLPNARNVGDAVRRHVLAALPGATPTVRSAAKALGMSRSTVNRRLALEGTSFTTILDGTRHRLALKFIAEDGLDAAEVATRLGFSEASGFYRAFKRWTRTTPGEYRSRVSPAVMPTRPAPRSLTTPDSAGYS